MYLFTVYAHTHGVCAGLFTCVQAQSRRGHLKSFCLSLMETFEASSLPELGVLVSLTRLGPEATVILPSLLSLEFLAYSCVYVGVCRGVCVCVCVCVYMHNCLSSSCPQRSEDGVGFPGAAVTDSCELPV